MNINSKLKCPSNFGRYTLVRELGAGAMGAVFLAKDNQLGREVALKTPIIDNNDKDLIESFKKEAQLAASINHPHICPIFDVGIQDDTPYLTMAYIEGQTLENYLASGKTLNFRQTITLIRKISLAIHEAHRKGIIHRDLKPGNIMLNKAGEPVVMDFGLAKNSNKVGSNNKNNNSVTGTPAYMAPEQFIINSSESGESCDQYSIGVMFYQLISGKLPFEAESLIDLISKINNENPIRPSLVNPEISLKLEKICLKTLNKNSEFRYANLKELVFDLNEYLKMDLSTLSNRPSVELSQQTAGEIRVSQMLGGRSMEIASRILADARTHGSEPPFKKKKKKKRTINNRYFLTLFSLCFLTFLAAVVFYKNRTYIGFNIFAKKSFDQDYKNPQKNNGPDEVLANTNTPPITVETDSIFSINSPFTAEKAKEKQEEIARILKTPVIEKISLEKDIPLDMVLIPAGKFLMGSSVSEKGRFNNENQHQVMLSKPFYFGKYEITQEQWEIIMGKNPSKIKGAKLPITNVSWEDSQEFIKRLNQKSDGGYRLPTEAEWEFACRAGTTTAYFTGDLLTKDDANIDDTVIKNVGNYKPNSFGLYDMHGNVWEWCSDWYGDYKNNLETDPRGPSTGIFKIIRGGSYFYSEVNNLSRTRSAMRPFDCKPNLEDHDIGLRLAKTIAFDIKNLEKTSIPKDSSNNILNTENYLIAPFDESKAKEKQKTHSRLCNRNVEEIIELKKGIKLELLFIPAGKFKMGSPISEKGHRTSEPLRDVTISKPFYMGKYEITQEQWVSIMGSNPSEIIGPKLPVTKVSWFDIQEFLEKLNSKTNKDEKFRLPLSSEWEYACRAGTTSAYSFGDFITSLDANVNGLSTVNVGSYKANSFGLYDMHGNAAEWVSNCGGKISDKSNKSKSNTEGSSLYYVRGGYFLSPLIFVRSANQNTHDGNAHSKGLGFRVVKNIKY